MVTLGVGTIMKGYRITLPKKVRRRLKLSITDYVLFEEINGNVVILPAVVKPKNEGH